MLVLTRKHDEKIRIGENITITILKTKGKAVRLGIEAPSEVAVVRGELIAAAESMPSQESAKLAKPGPESKGSSRRLRPRVGMCETAWPVEARPQDASGARRCQPAPEVTLQRMPRAAVAQVLPRLIGDSGPLRSLVEQRTSV